MSDILNRETPNRETLNQLLNTDQQICLSLYMPTHRSFPERNQNPIRYKNLLRQLREQLSQQQPNADHTPLLQPFYDLLDDHEFWSHLRDGMAVLGGEHFFHIYTVHRPVPERVMVNHRPYLTPLLRIVQSADTYQVLCLSRDAVRLFEGNRDVLNEIPLAPEVPKNQVEALGSDLTPGDQSGHPDGFSAASERGDPYMHEAGGSGKQDEIDKDRESFFRAVDRAITAHHSKPSGLPLLLAALPENQFFFRAISHNQQLIEPGITIDPGALDIEVLRQRSWQLMSQYYQQRLEGILATYGTSRGQGLASDQLAEIGQATVAGRVATLLVEADRVVPGQFEQTSGHVKLQEDINRGELDNEYQDVLDEVMLQALQQGGEVIVVPPERMPSKTGAAAVFRY